MYLLQRGFDLFKDNILYLYYIVDAQYQIVNKEKRQVKVQRAGSNIKDLAEEEGLKSNVSVKDNNEEEATRAVKQPYQEATTASRYINKLAKKLL